MPRLHCPHCQATTDHTIAVGGEILVAWCKICLESHSLSRPTPEDADVLDGDDRGARQDVRPGCQGSR